MKKKLWCNKNFMQQKWGEGELKLLKLERVICVYVPSSCSPRGSSCILLHAPSLLPAQTLEYHSNKYPNTPIFQYSSIILPLLT